MFLEGGRKTQKTECGHGFYWVLWMVNSSTFLKVTNLLQKGKSCVTELGGNKQQEKTIRVQSETKMDVLVVSLEHSLKVLEESYNWLPSRTVSE